MYASLLRIYANTKSEAYLSNAVKKGWITKEQKAEIMSAVA